MQVIFRFGDFMVSAPVDHLSFSDDCLSISTSDYLTGIVVEESDDKVFVECCTVTDWSAYDG